MALDPQFRTTPFPEAIAFLRQRINLPTAKWNDITDSAHDAFFVVAGAKASLLSEIREAIDRAIATGQSLTDFQQVFRRIADGWISGDRQDWRARLIYSTVLRTAYAAGRYAQQLDPEVKRLQPYLQFVHSGAEDFRPAHKALDGMVFEADRLPIFPPAGYFCGCKAISLSDRDLQREGLEVSDIKRGDEIDGVTIDPDEGFDYVPGQSSAERRRQMVAAIIDRTPEPIKSQLVAELEAIDQEFANG